MCTGFPDAAIIIAFKNNFCILFRFLLGCVCNDVGTEANTVCDGRSGQCQCKPGVMLQDCSMCKVYHYGFSSGTGCTGNT